MNLKQTTCEGYRKRIENVIKPRIGSIPLATLTPMVLQTFINEVFNDGYSRNALSSIKGILSSSLRFAVSPAGLLSVNPANAVRLPHTRAKPKTKARRKERQPISPNDWDRVIARFPREHPSHIPLMLGYHLGLRLGETFGLCWEDVDFQRATITVQRQVQYDDNRKSWYLTPPKYDSNRTITMDDELTALLSDEHQRQKKAKEYYGARYHQVCIDSDGVFVVEGQPIHLICVRENGSYIQPRTMLHTNRVVHKELGLPRFDFHTLRHTHATMLLEAGASLFDIKERLGHTKIEVTQRYVHNTDLQRERTTQILNSIYSVK